MQRSKRDKCIHGLQTGGRSDSCPPLLQCSLPGTMMSHCHPQGAANSTCDSRTWRESEERGRHRGKLSLRPESEPEDHSGRGREQATEARRDSGRGAVGALGTPA